VDDELHDELDVDLLHLAPDLPEACPGLMQDVAVFVRVQVSHLLDGLILLVDDLLPQVEHQVDQERLFRG